jgi:hypothetical protein
MTGPNPQHNSSMERALLAAGRSAAIAAAWVMAVGIGVAGFSAGSQPRFGEVVTFGFEFAIACVFAAVVALAVGGRRRWAMEASLAIAAWMILAAVVVVSLLWLVPWTTWRFTGMGSQEFLLYRRMVGGIATDLLRTWGRIGSGLGLVTGVVAGLLMRLARRRPGLASGLAAGLLLGIGALSGAASGLITDLVLEARLEHGNWKVSSIRQDELSAAIGAVAGSIVGALAAYIARRVWRPPAPEGSKSPEGRPSRRASASDAEWPRSGRSGTPPLPRGSEDHPDPSSSAP